jgi:biotin operon repressor
VASSKLQYDCLLILKSRTGERYAIGGAELAKRLGMRGSQNDARIVREIVHELRKNGNPILASHDGYFLPDSYQEADKFCNSLKAHAIEEIITRRDIRKGLATYFEEAKARKMF